jgi:hypothetical protein
VHRILTSTALTLVAAQALVSGQGRDANQVLAEVRAALGGNKLEAVKTLSGTGRTLRTGPGGNTVESEFDLALELPDKYRLRTALASLGNMSVYRLSGFNGSQIIEEVDRPPNLAGGTHIVMRVAGPGGAAMDPAKMTPEQKAEANRQRLLGNKKEFARLTLGMFATSFGAYPLEFAYAGQAEAPDGKADVIDVKGEGGFAVRLFLDASSHLPLMVTWMDKEPLVMRVGPGGNVTTGGGGTVVQRIVGGGAPDAAAGPGQPAKLSKEDVEKFEKDLDAKRAEAEAARRTVEYRVYYGEYQAVGGVKLPHRILRSIDGKTTEEMVFEAIKVNGKIDARDFQPSK